MRSVIITILAGVSLSAVAFTAGGAEGDSAALTLDACIKAGLQNALTVANARRDEAIANARIRQVRSEAFPQVSANAAYTRLDEVGEFDMGGGPITLGDLDNYSVTMSLRQQLYSGGRLMAATRAARLSRRYALLARRRAEEQLVRDIMVSFNNLLLLQSSVQVEREAIDHMRDMLDLATSQYRAGTVPEFDVLSAKVRLANEMPKLTAVDNTLEIASGSFGILIGLETNTVRIAGSLSYEPEDFSVEALQQSAMTNRLEIILLELALGMMKEDIAAARSSGLPSVSATVNYVGANSYSASPFEQGWQWHWNAGATMQWNLFDGGLRGGAVLKKALELEQASEELKTLRQAAHLEIRQEYLRMMQAREVLEGADEAVALAEKVRAIARTRYESGAGTALELAESNLAVGAAKLRRLQAMGDHMNAVAGLKYAAGIELSSEEDRP